jgi:hypothetical protein
MPSPEELYDVAVRFWPTELIEREARSSVIPRLLETQDRFISLLDVADSSPDAWKKALKASKSLTANLFLKHLMVLSDVGGELLQRLRPELRRVFPSSTMTFGWKGATHRYTLKSVLSTKRLTNTILAVDGRGLMNAHGLSYLMEDVAMLVLHGGACTAPGVPEPIMEKCVIGGLMGQRRELATFVKQRYILVSRITQGARTNTLGQLAQDYVIENLESALDGWTFKRNGTIPGISQNAGLTDISFDVVARSPNGRHFAIEVSFQVTTNSVIERKAGQAKARAEALHAAGHRIAYVIDGAGNFQRQAALRTICKFSDCTVTMREDQLETLAQFLRDSDNPANSRRRSRRD